MAAPESGTRLAEGIYDYTLDDRSFAKEIWRITRRDVPRELVEQHKTHYVHFRKKNDELE